jgi:hypothetical protein
MAARTGTGTGSLIERAAKVGRTEAGATKSLEWAAELSAGAVVLQAVLMSAFGALT